MYTCLLCKYPTELDDVVATPRQGRCICLRCFHGQVGDQCRINRALRHAIEEVLERPA